MSLLPIRGKEGVDLSDKSVIFRTGLEFSPVSAKWYKNSALKKLSEQVFQTFRTALIVKIFVTALFFSLFLPVFSQETPQTDAESLPLAGDTFRHRIGAGSYLALYSTNTGIIDAGYDAVFRVLRLTPDYNLLDISLGADILFILDGNNSMPRFIPGIGVNAGGRLYVLPIRKIRSRIFLEVILGFVVYAREYPDNGTYINFARHLGLGVEYRVNDYSEFFAAARWFHTSNADLYGRERNPGLNGIGIVCGIQFRKKHVFKTIDKLHENWYLD